MLVNSSLTARVVRPAAASGVAGATHLSWRRQSGDSKRVSSFETSADGLPAYGTAGWR